MTGVKLSVPAGKFFSIGKSVRDNLPNLRNTFLSFIKVVVLLSSNSDDLKDVVTMGRKVPRLLINPMFAALA